MDKTNGTKPRRQGERVAQSETSGRRAKSASPGSTIAAGTGKDARRGAKATQTQAPRPTAGKRPALTKPALSDPDDVDPEEFEKSIAESIANSVVVKAPHNEGERQQIPVPCGHEGEEFWGRLSPYQTSWLARRWGRRITALERRQKAQREAQTDHLAKANQMRSENAQALADCVAERDRENPACSHVEMAKRLEAEGYRHKNGKPYTARHIGGIRNKQRAAQRKIGR